MSSEHKHCSNTGKANTILLQSQSGLEKWLHSHSNHPLPLHTFSHPGLGSWSVPWHLCSICTDWSNTKRQSGQKSLKKIKLQPCPPVSSWTAASDHETTFWHCRCRDCYCRLRSLASDLFCVCTSSMWGHVSESKKWYDLEVSVVEWTVRAYVCLGAQSLPLHTTLPRSPPAVTLLVSSKQRQQHFLFLCIYKTSIVWFFVCAYYFITFLLNPADICWCPILQGFNTLISVHLQHTEQHIIDFISVTTN